MRSNPLDVDGARLSDLSIGGWVGVAIAAGGVVFAVYATVTSIPSLGDIAGGLLIGGFIALVGGMIAYENATAAYDGTCENCGQRVRGHSSREGVDEYVRVHSSGSPRRASLGPLSVVTERQTTERVYCSGACAAEDDRVLLERHGDQLEPAMTSDDRSEEARA